jgi:hypothetical protein
MTVERNHLHPCDEQPILRNRSDESASDGLSRMRRPRSKIRGVIVRATTQLNFFALLFSANRALLKLDALVEPWVCVVKEDILKVRKGINDCLCKGAQDCFGGEVRGLIYGCFGVGVDG